MKPDQILRMISLLKGKKIHFFSLVHKEKTGSQIIVKGRIEYIVTDLKTQAKSQCHKVN